MANKIEDSHHDAVLTELLNGGTQCTYVTKNRLWSRMIAIKTSHVLMIMKKLETLGFVKSNISGLGYVWTLTESGREKAEGLIIRK